MNAPCESTGEAEMRGNEMPALLPDERAMVWTYCALQMVILPADICAHLCDGFVLRNLFTVAETEIDIARIHFMRIRKMTHFFPDIISWIWDIGLNSILYNITQILPASLVKMEG